MCYIDVSLSTVAHVLTAQTQNLHPSHHQKRCLSSALRQHIVTYYRLTRNHHTCYWPWSAVRSLSHQSHLGLEVICCTSRRVVFTYSFNKALPSTASLVSLSALLSETLKAELSLNFDLFTWPCEHPSILPSICCGDKQSMRVNPECTMFVTSQELT